MASGAGIVHALLARGARVVIADVEGPALAAAVDGVRVLGVRCAGCAPTSPIRTRSMALADDVYGSEGRCDLLFANAGVTSGGGGLPWEQEINDWRWCFSVNVFGVAATVLTFLPRMLEAGIAGRDRRHLVGRRRRGARALRQRVRRLEGCGQLLHRSRRPPAARTVDAPVHAHVFYPGGGLLDTGLWTAARNRPAALERIRPRPPAPGTTFAEFKAQLEAAGLPTTVVDLDWLGAQVLDDLDDGRYILGPDADRFGNLLHARADAIAHGDLPPTLLH